LRVAHGRAVAPVRSELPRTECYAGRPPRPLVTEAAGRCMKRGVAKRIRLRMANFPPWRGGINSRFSSIESPMDFSQRRAAQVLLDFSCAVGAWIIAYTARFNFDLDALASFLKPQTIVVFAIVQTAALAVLGNYSRIWRYTSISDLRLLISGVVLGSAVVLALAIAVPVALFVPRGVLLTQPFVFLVFICGGRLLWRMYREATVEGKAPMFGDPIIVVGAGDAGEALLSEFRRSRRWRAVGLLDDDPAKKGRMLHGVRVLGSTEDFARESVRLHVHKAVIAIPSLSDERRKELARVLSAQGAEVFTLPPLDALHRGDVVDDSMRRVRPEELLRRDPVVHDRTTLQQAVQGKVVMVTGAGGSIGAELCRQVADLKPQLLVMLELNEFVLYQISEELRAGWQQLNQVTVIGDVRDEARVAEVMARYRPQVVFHAAAYKHVPMMEQVNAFEAIRNNAWGSLVVAMCAVSARVERLVIVSTDKAVNPTNVMGATKRLAELLVQTEAAGTELKLSIVRFGNVLGSAGSVIPRFLEQIQRRGPVTVTHPEMTRYFMSIPEAAQLVILSSGLGQGGEVFVLDMGEPVRIVDLAEDLIRLSGRSRQSIDIVFTGLRPGEKLYEELLFDKETSLPTEHPRIRIAQPHGADRALEAQFVNWLKDRPTRSDFEVRQMLRRLVPEYTPDARIHFDHEKAA
jgi:FlaA1/EpsC-like NDP-sugar epimerase